jgi:alkylhydroperoxidase family enzyme
VSVAIVGASPLAAARAPRLNLSRAGMSMRMIATLCLAIALCSAAARAGRADEFGRVEQGSAATRTAWTMPE